MSSCVLPLITVLFIIPIPSTIPQDLRQIPDHVYAYADPRYSPRFERYVDAQIENHGAYVLSSPDIDSYMQSISSPMNTMDIITFHRNSRRMSIQREREARMDENRRRMQFGLSVPTTAPSLPPVTPDFPDRSIWDYKNKMTYC